MNPSNVETTPHALYQVQGGAAKLRELVEYGLLLLRSEVTVPALLTLTQQILKDHWCLPVGEIGKLLQEATSNSGLSSTLKERFGGLKRFIEGYPDIFLVATDHRFNPLVYLCSGLTIEQSTQIKAGVSLTSNNQRIIDQGGNGDGVPATTTASKRNSRRKTRKGNSSRKRNKALKKQNSNAGKHDTKEEKIGAASGGGGAGGGGGGGLGSNQLQATAVEFVPSF
jgi:hypothetical protein